MTYDYIIVGAGSAGAGLPSRLSGEPDHHNLLLQGGPGESEPGHHPSCVHA
ncbi:MAG: GMC family oxidoreductase N-terminal domain-containing protein, partial [Dehalococcoidia bacterium]|nr:GMC family oxidoreductase N-terminal domain-containing protein [Dehalococcoidia bacterium]